MPKEALAMLTEEDARLLRFLAGKAWRDFLHLSALPPGVERGTLLRCQWNGYMAVRGARCMITDLGRAALDEAA